MMRTARPGGGSPSNAAVWPARSLPAAADARGLFVGTFFPRLPRQPVQDPQHLVEIGEHMGLGAAKRGHADPGEPLLQRAPIVLTQNEVVGKISRTRVIVGRDVAQHLLRAPFRAAACPRESPTVRRSAVRQTCWSQVRPSRSGASAASTARVFRTAALAHPLASGGRRRIANPRDLDRVRGARACRPGRRGAFRRHHAAS